MNKPEPIQLYQAPDGEVTDAFGFSIAWCPPEHRSLVNDLAGIEAASIDSEREGFSWKYRPYPISRFGAALRAAVTSAARRPQNFLEVGCGVGTKLVMAERIFNLDAVGIDIFPEYLESSRKLIQHHGLRASAVECDATTFAYYSGYDVIFVNSPLWDYDTEYLLELKIMSEMHEGAILMLGNQKVKDVGWPTLTSEIALNVYMKPRATV